MRVWLKNARQNRGLTMKQFAQKLHISESYYCYIENGCRQRDMDLSLAEKIAEILNLPIKQVLLYESDERRGEM